jgi:hypothetical protein
MAGGSGLTQRLAHDRVVEAPRQAILGAALSGVMWGAGSFLLSLADQFDHRLLFVWAVVMISVAAMFSFSACFPCFLAFVIPWEMTNHETPKLPNNILLLNSRP